jgi:hypothetical protein
VPGEDNWRPPSSKIVNADSFTLGSELWTRQPFVDHSWNLASDDVQFSTGPTGKPLPSPRHFHTSFDFAGHSIHIDFVRFVQWGPLSGVEQFIGFVDGQFNSRGGHYVLVPGAWKRGWPFVMRFADAAIVIHEFRLSLRDQPFKDISFWAIR